MKFNKIKGYSIEWDRNKKEIIFRRIVTKKVVANYGYVNDTDEEVVSYINCYAKGLLAIFSG